MATAFANRAPTVGLGFIMAELGRAQMSARWQVGFVELLIEKEGFPPPLPDRRGGRLIGHVTTHSRWQRIAVDQWFLDRLPPDTAAADDSRRQHAANDDMDHAAGDLAASLNARRHGGATVQA